MGGKEDGLWRKNGGGGTLVKKRKLMFTSKKGEEKGYGLLKCLVQEVNVESLFFFYGFFPLCYLFIYSSIYFQFYYSIILLRFFFVLLSLYIPVIVHFSIGLYFFSLILFSFNNFPPSLFVIRY